MNRHFTEEDKQMANKHTKQCSVPLATREIQIKTPISYHYTSTKIAKVKNSDNPKCWWECGSLIHCWWECKIVQPLWRRGGQFFTKSSMHLPCDPAVILGHLPCDPAVIIRHLSQSNEKLYSHKNVFTNIHKNFTHSITKVEAIQMLFNQKINKWWYIHMME